MIYSSLSGEIVAAMKARDSVRLSTLRMLLSALNYVKIDKHRDLTSEEELEVVNREAKKRREAIEIYKKAGEHERADQEQKELAILEEYLPKQMSDEEITHIVEATIAEMGASKENLGQVIGAVVHKVGGLADGKRVSELVKSKLLG